jgi:hypothetical protein
LREDYYECCITSVTPTQEALDLYGIEAIAKKDVPHNLPYKIVEDAVIPADREFRNAWTIDDAELTDGVGGELNTFEELV